MRHHRALLFTLSAAVLVAGTGPDGCLVNKPARLDPLRLYSIGDSITRAFDAWFVADNLPVSWVNGYHGFWQGVLGVPNVLAHNQRIDAFFGTSGRTNVMAAENGARWDDALDQAQGIVGEQPTYVTVMLGGNDVCRDSPADLPTNEEIEGHVQATFDFLEQNLTPGSTVQVVGIPDVKRLHDVGLSEKGLLGINCSAIWLTTALGFPCGSMLSPDNTEADRLYVQSRNFAYNDIIQANTTNYNLTSDNVYFHYADAETVAFTGDDISSIDCFHPSDDGEELIGTSVWQAGPFGSVFGQ